MVGIARPRAHFPRPPWGREGPCPPPLPTQPQHNKIVKFKKEWLWKLESDENLLVFRLTFIAFLLMMRSEGAGHKRTQGTPTASMPTAVERRYSGATSARSPSPDYGGRLPYALTGGELTAFGIRCHAFPVWEVRMNVSLRLPALTGLRGKNTTRVADCLS